ncbi:hypothetical protein, partial [Mycobacterium sp. 1245801.1]|uniref:hypothetical protein n=1 Tax=Mycobacterium sp. 1245801.1 TaxID=1834075 RepID=UPI000AEC9185
MGLAERLGDFTRNGLSGSLQHSRHSWDRLPPDSIHASNVARSSSLSWSYQAHTPQPMRLRVKSPRRSANPIAANTFRFVGGPLL